MVGPGRPDRPHRRLDGPLERGERIGPRGAGPHQVGWTEAARYAGAADPEAYGERVRRKLKRLGARHTARARATTATATRQGARTHGQEKGAEP